MNLTQTMEPGVCSLWAFSCLGSLRANRGGSQPGKWVLTRAEWCPPGGLRKRSLEMMNGNVNGMTIRLLGCALAMLVLAAMSVTTGSFAKAADARDAAQANHVAAEDVVWEMK